MLLIQVLTLALGSLSALALPPRYPRADTQASQVTVKPVKPVKWITDLGASIPADSEVKLEWEGGDGNGWVSLGVDNPHADWMETMGAQLTSRGSTTFHNGLDKPSTS
jgi:hypothetical protein